MSDYLRAHLPCRGLAIRRAVFIDPADQRPVHSKLDFSGLFGDGAAAVVGLGLMASPIPDRTRVVATESAFIPRPKGSWAGISGKWFQGHPFGRRP